MEFIRKALKIMLPVSLIFCSGCNLSNEKQRTGLSEFHINEPEEERNGSFEKTYVSEPVATIEKDITTDDKIPLSTIEGSASVPYENNMEEVISFEKTDSSGDITERSVDNWLLDGFVVPENWQEVLTTEEAFENFDAITAPLPKGVSPEDEIVLLMNRNILCFDTRQLGSFELIDHVSSVGGEAEMLLARVYSEHFKSVQDIKNLYHQTYTETYAHYLFYGTEDNPRQIFIRDEEGILWVNFQKVGNWVTDPFRNRSYIEIVNRSESLCEFIWHYISYDFTDLSCDFFPIHHTINGFAINENDEWRLSYLILDNPELNRPTFKWRPVSIN